MPRKKKGKENRDPSFTIGTGYTRRTGGYDPNKDRRGIKKELMRLKG